MDRPTPWIGLLLKPALRLPLQELLQGDDLPPSRAWAVKPLQNLDNGLRSCRGSFGSRFEYALMLRVFPAAHGPAALDIAARIRYNNTRTARP